MGSSKDSGSGNNNENRNNENNGSNSITILSPVRRSPSSPAVVFRVPLDDNIVEPTTPIFNYAQQPINSAIIPSPLTLWRLYHPVSPPPLGYYSPRPLSPLYDRYIMYPCITPYMARFIHGGHEYHRMVSPICNHIISGLNDNPTSSAPPTNPNSENSNHINAVGEDGDNDIAEAGPSSSPANSESDDDEEDNEGNDQISM